MSVLQIELQPDELELLTHIANEHGYASPDAYVRKFIVESILEPDPYDDSIEQILEDLKQGWREAKRGEGISWEEAMKMLEEDDD